MKTVNQLIILFAVMLCFYCQEPISSPTEFELDKRESDVQIKMIEAKDTIFVWGNISLKSTIEVGNQTVDSIKVFLDDKEIYSFLDYYFVIPTGFAPIINIKTKDYSDGWYELKYKTYSHISPNSSSRFYYYFIDTVKVKMNIDNAPPKRIDNVESQIIDGKLQINWAKYLRGNFQYYEIVKNNIENQSKTITDSDSSFWIDPDYVGGASSYRVNIKAADYEVQGINTEIEYPLPKVTTKSINSEGIQVSWSKSLFDSTFATYRIMRRLGNLNEWEEIYTAANIEDTSYFDKIFLFGNHIYYRIDVASSNKITNGNISSSYFGTILPSFQELKYSLDKNLIYLLNPAAMDPSTHIYNAESMMLLRTNIARVPIFSDNCSMAYYITNVNRLTRIDPLTFNSIEEYELEKHTGRELAMIDEVSASRNERVIFRGFTFSSPTYYFDRFYLFDLSENKVLASMGNYKPVENVSHDLNAFVKDEGLYKYTEQYGISGTGVVLKELQYCFYPEVNGFITAHENRITITDLNSFTTSNEFPIEDPLYYLSIDEKYNYLGGATSKDQSKVYRVYDLNNGSLVLEMSTVLSKYWLANGMIFSSAGLFISIDSLINP